VLGTDLVWLGAGSLLRAG